MTQYLKELLPPRCQYCGYEKMAGAVGYFCDCPQAMDARIASANAHYERKLREGWQEQDLLQEIQKEARTI